MVKVFVINLLIFLTAPAIYGEQLHVLEGEYFGMEYYKIKHLRDPYFPEYDNNSGEEEWSYGSAALFDINVLRYSQWELQWRNRVHMDVTNRQVRHVGWQWETGLNLWPGKLDTFYRHHSRHALDEDSQTRRPFPVRDEYVIRFNFYKRDKR